MLPDLSALSLEPREVAPIGKNGDQCDPTKSRDKLKCVRMRLHPNVFNAVRDRINLRKYNADSTSICFLGPLSLRDQRFRTRSIEDTLYKSEQWVTLRNKYLYRNEHEQKGAGFFAWGSDIKIRPGTYQPGSGWTILPESLRHRTWYDVAGTNGNTWQQPPREETNGYYESGLFGAELCMVPAWDYVKYPEDTAAFVVALYDYNVDHPAYWIQKVEERMLAAEAQAAAQRGRARATRDAAGPSEPETRQELARDARAEKLQRRELAQARLRVAGAESRAARAERDNARRQRNKERDRQRAEEAESPEPAPAPAPDPDPGPAPPGGWWWAPEAQPPKPASPGPELPPNNQMEGWLKELEAQGRRAPTPPPEPRDDRDDPNSVREILEDFMRQVQDDPDAYSNMFS